MKIISKYKDFYDFNFLYGKPDETLVYKRECAVDNSKAPKGTLPQLYMRSAIYYGSYLKSHNKLPFYVADSIIGIYPYLFHCPYVGLLTDDRKTVTKTIPIDFNNATDGKSWLKFLQDNVDSSIRREQLYKTQRDFLTQKIRWRDIRAEEPKYFEYYKSPVLIIDPNITMLSHAEFGSIDKSQHIKVIKDFCINSLACNPLKYHWDFINDMDVYSNIENFLFSMKQEPVSDPSNETKIVNAGFDLKTSFRKM